MTGPEPAVVLVVDDEPAIADSYAAHAREEYDVRTAYSGEGALEKFDADVDVVLLDRRMPDIVGDDILARIREQEPDCRVAMVTAVDADFDIIEMEFDDYVVKPVSREALLDTIDRLLQCAEYEQRLREYYRVARTLVALESTKDRSELTDNAEFLRLRERRDDLREKLSATAAGLAEEDFDALFRDLDG